MPRCRTKEEEIIAGNLGVGVNLEFQGEDV